MNDLDGIDLLAELAQAGVGSIKIEGRMRSPEYVKTVVNVYRLAIDTYFKEGNLSDKMIEKLEKKLSTVYNRDFSKGFYMGKPINEFTDEYGSKATMKKIYLGKIKNYYSKIGVFEMKLETRSVKIDDTIMVQGPTTGVIEEKISSIQINNKNVKEAKQKDWIGLKLKNKVRPNDKVFLIE